MAASPNVNHLAVRHSKSIRNLRGANQLIYVDTTTHAVTLVPSVRPVYVLEPKRVCYNTLTPWEGAYEDFRILVDDRPGV